MRFKKCMGIIAVILIIAMFTACGVVPSPGKDNPSQTSGDVRDDPKQQNPETAAARKDAIEKASLYTQQYDYEKAIELLSDPAIANEETQALISDIEAKENELVPYTGDIKHIFFHSLIVYPEMVFKDKTTPMGGYNSGFSEKQELEKILPQLYDRGYVLYDISQCFEMSGGKMARKEILLPPGKQPLILSVDDVAYAYGDGYAQKLTLNDKGELVNLVKNPAGTIEEMPDGDVFGVVDAFVREHPDFSYRGHKGTLAMTGYQGAFGFSFDIPEEQEQIKKVVSALKEDGWSFASHSYTHNRNGYFGPDSNIDKIKYDTDKWNRLISPFFGDTDIFIAPFGYRLEGDCLRYVLDSGFRIYCTVDAKVKNEVYDDYALMTRIEIGGYSMTYYKTLLNNNFFNVDEVFDSVGRPPVI